MRRMIVALIALLLSAPALAADWVVGPAPSDDPDMLAATVMNEDGDALFLWSRRADKRYQVFAELHLGRGMAFGEAMPVYRIDGAQAVDTDAVRREGDDVGALWGHVGGGTAFWLIWTSIQNVVLPSDGLHRWFEGREIVIEYIAADGSAHAARFTLGGARPAILRATDLTAE